VGLQGSIIKNLHFRQGDPQGASLHFLHYSITGGLKINNCVEFYYKIKSIVKCQNKGNVSVYDDYLCKEFLYHKVLKGTV